MQNIIFLSDFDRPELDLFTRLNERELAHYYEPEGGLFIPDNFLGGSFHSSKQDQKSGKKRK